jgi:hypothetical protein
MKKRTRKSGEHTTDSTDCTDKRNHGPRELWAENAMKAQQSSNRKQPRRPRFLISTSFPPFASVKSSRCARRQEAFGQGLIPKLKSGKQQKTSPTWRREQRVGFCPVTRHSSPSLSPVTCHVSPFMVAPGVGGTRPGSGSGVHDLFRSAPATGGHPDCLRDRRV